MNDLRPRSDFRLASLCFNNNRVEISGMRLTRRVSSSSVKCVVPCFAVAPLRLVTKGRTQEVETLKTKTSL